MSLWHPRDSFLTFFFWCKVFQSQLCSQLAQHVTQLTPLMPPSSFTRYPEKMTCNQRNVVYPSLHFIFKVSMLKTHMTIILKSTSFHGPRNLPTRSFTGDPKAPRFFFPPPRRNVSPITECRRSAKKSKWATRNGRLGLGILESFGQEVPWRTWWHDPTFSTYLEELYIITYNY